MSGSTYRHDTRSTEAARTQVKAKAAAAARSAGPTRPAQTFVSLRPSAEKEHARRRLLAEREARTAQSTEAVETVPPITGARAFVSLRPRAREQDVRRAYKSRREPDDSAHLIPPVRTARAFVPLRPTTQEQEARRRAQQREVQEAQLRVQQRDEQLRVQYPAALPGTFVSPIQETVEGLAIVGCQHRRTADAQRDEAALLHDLADLLEPVTPTATRTSDPIATICLPAGVDVGIVPNENFLDASGNPVCVVPPSAPIGSNHTGRVLNRGYIVVTDDFARSNPALNVSETVTMYQTAFDGAPLPLAVDPIRGEASMEVERYVARAAEDYRPVFRRRDSWSVYGRAAYQVNVSSPSAPSSPSSRTVNRTLA